MNIGAQKQMILMETMSYINGALAMEGKVHGFFREGNLEKYMKLTILGMKKGSMR